jgi:DNA-binding LacI/PurR family transcriptional regulator
MRSGFLSFCNETDFSRLAVSAEKRMTKVTIYEIAKKAGVSPATVSRAIHSPYLLSQVTLERVQTIMRESDYSYNAAAANLARGSSTTIHVFIPALGSTVFSATVMGVQEVAFRHNLTVVVASTNYDGRYEIELLKQAREQRCAGILLTGLCKKNEGKAFALAKAGVPIVVMWENGPEGMHSVGFDNYEVSRRALEYLVSLGHRRIAGIFGPCSFFHRAQMRLDAYRDVMIECGLGIDPALISENRPNIKDGKKTMAALLRLADPPTAVFCTNDLQAVGAYDVIRKAGLTVPDDISVFGFDDIEVAPYLSPPLSTVRVPSYEIGRRAAELLLDLLNAPDSPVTRLTVDTPLRLRGSCAPPPDPHARPALDALPGPGRLRAVPFRLRLRIGDERLLISSPALRPRRVASRQSTSGRNPASRWKGG